MRIISLGLDASVLDKNSLLAKKTIEYGSMVEKYFMIVPAGQDKNVVLSANVTVYGVAGFSRPVKLWKMYILAKLLVRKYKCDLVTTQDPFELGMLGYLLRRRFKIAWNVQEHGDFFSQKFWRNEGFLNKWRYLQGKRLLKKADSIRVVSERTRQYLTDFMRISKESITVVPVLTNRPDSKLLRECATSADRFTFLNMGRFVAQKNLPLLLKAFSAVNKKYPDSRLLLIGRGPQERELKKIVREKNLESAVDFKSWTDKVYDHFLSADAYVLSSNYEGWGRVIVEAAICELPVIMTNVGCAGELIINNESGLVVDVSDEIALAEAMERLITNAELRITLASGAKEALTKLPNKEKTLRLYKESWERAIDRMQIHK